MVVLINQFYKVNGFDNKISDNNVYLYMI